MIRTTDNRAAATVAAPIETEAPILGSVPTARWTNPFHYRLDEPAIRGIALMLFGESTRTASYATLLDAFHTAGICITAPMLVSGVFAEAGGLAEAVRQSGPSEPSFVAYQKREWCTCIKNEIDGGMTVEEVAAEFNFTVSTVEKCLAIARAVDALPVEELRIPTNPR